MNRAWFIVWALVVCQVAAWAFAPQKPAEPARPTDGPGYGSNETIFVDGRARTRREATLAFEIPYGSRCAGEGRKRFIAQYERTMSGETRAARGTDKTTLRSALRAQAHVLRRAVLDGSPYVPHLEEA